MMLIDAGLAAPDATQASSLVEPRRRAQERADHVAVGACQRALAARASAMGSWRAESRIVEQMWTALRAVGNRAPPGSGG